MMNPYWGNNFFDFFITLFHRLKGDLPLDRLPSDEIQLLVLAGVGLASALIGTFLTLKKMTMLANSLSHTILLGIVIACLILSTTHLTLMTLMIASLITALMTSLLTQLVTHVLKLQEDASIGLIFTSLFALGVVLVTLFTRNAHIGIEAVMGNVDALHVDDIRLIGVVAGIDLLACLLFFKQFQTTAFDPAHGSAIGISINLFNTFLMVLTAMTTVAAFRSVGVILVLAFIVGPPLIARLWTHHLRFLLFLSSVIGIGISVFGVALSRHLLSVYNLPLSTGGLIVTCIGIAYIASLTLRGSRGLIRTQT
jgi:manganese/zinc/iron transport system permease protein